MYEQKTKETDNSVIEFIENIESPKKRDDAYKLLDILQISLKLQILSIISHF